MTQIAISSLNLLNLRLPGRPFYGLAGYSPQEYQTKTHWMGALFDRLHSDFIAVQEVFDEAALQDCVAASATMRNAQVVIAPGAEGDANLPRVGLIAAQPLLAPVESIADLPTEATVVLPGAPELNLPETRHTSFSRPVLATTINLGSAGKPIPARLYVIHLKSRRPKRLQLASPDNSNDEGFDDTDASGPSGENMDNPAIEARAHMRALMMRAAEAAGLRQLLLRDLVNSRMPVIVAGDFNDHAKAMTTEMITGRIYRRQLNRRDHTLWHAGALQRPNVLKRDVGYTKIHLGEPDSIDHILLSEEFLRDSKHAIGEVMRVDWFNDHLNNPATTQTDHGAIRATLRLH